MFEHLRQELAHLPFLTNKDLIVHQLSYLLKKIIGSYKSPGIAFSGGLDSSVLALLAKDPVLYTIALENSSDVAWSLEVAKKMGRRIKTRTISLEEAEQIIRKVVHLLKSTDVTHVGIGCVVYAVLEMAKKDGVSVVLGGLGAEEIFGGYKRHIDYGKDLDHIHDRLWEGLKDMEVRDFARDLPIAQHFQIQLEAPFLNETLVRYAMQIHPSLKINHERRKIILQETAFHLGLPREVAFRKKMAAQYSSKFDRAIHRLARRNGFNLKKAYLQHLLKK